MKQQIDQTLPRLAPAIRRAMLLLLAVSYLFVGMAHTMSCAAADKAVAFAVTVDAGTNSAPHGSDSKSSALVAESCHFWLPIVMPLPCAVTAPSSDLGRLAWAGSPDLMAGHSRLDTPPPKPLI